MNKKHFVPQRLLFAVLSITLFLFIITFSISLPIFIRPFYYAHIDALNLTQSGFSKAEIKEAYNEVLDFLTLPGKEFSTGVLKHSNEGAAHFYDCKKLFTLNTSVLLISAAVIIITFLIKRTKKLKPLYVKGFSPAFYSATATLLLPIILGGLISINFEKAFIIFHKIFFSGKSNWIFNPETDQIINVLPEQFFMNCAILIGTSIFIISFIILIAEISKKYKKS